MRSLTRNLAVLAALLTLSGCHIAIGDGAFSASEDFEETLPFGSGSSLELTNVNGHVTVSTWDREEIRIEAEKFASSERRLDNVEIEIEETSGGVEVRTRLPKGGLFSGKGKVNYQITLPATAIVNVRTVNGKLVFTGVGGRLDAKTVNGSVEVERARGEVVATTVNGSIQASYEALDEHGRNRFSTTNGSVRIELPRDANGEFEARTINGRIRSDFDELEPTGRWGSRKLSGRLGTGGSSFEIKTINGSVRIEKRAQVPVSED